MASSVAETETPSEQHVGHHGTVSCSPRALSSVLISLKYYGAAFLLFDIIKVADLGWGKYFGMTIAVKTSSDLSHP